LLVIAAELDWIWKKKDKKKRVFFGDKTFRYFLTISVTFLPTNLLLRSSLAIPFIVLPDR